MIYATFFSLFSIISFAFAAPGFSAHGVSLDGKVKYEKNFKQFDYTSPEATKGGILVLHDIGSFDKMNPFSLKGEAPMGLESLVYEPLTIASLDEPFSQYGLLAKDIAVADDKKSVSFTLDSRARFSDGSPVTAEDVAFTLATLKGDRVHPSFNFYYQDIVATEIIAVDQIRFLFAQPNRELHMIAGQMRVMSKKFFLQHGFEEKEEARELIAPVASGPYVVDKTNIGKTITYKRNPNYWAIDHPARKGMDNFDEIVVKYYKDQTVALEAFKAGEFDFISINIAKQWARDMDGKRFAEGSIIKKTFPHQRNAGIQGFVMNTRRELFQNRNVRKAIGLALDFHWTNESLFHGQYTRNNSFFSNSYLAATGLPEGLERSYLEPYRDQIPQEVFTTAMSEQSPNDQPDIRKNLLEAKKILGDEGWQVRDGKLVNVKGGVFKFDILLVSPAFERVMAAYVKNLGKLGIHAEYRTIDPALYAERLKTFDFDMVVMSYGQSQSPGNEQRNYWHSSSAEKNGSQNYAGIKSTAVDGLINKIIYAETKEELVAGCKALDRVLWQGHYLIPNWYLPIHRLSYHNKFSMPTQLPIYYDPFQLLMTWWTKK